jgi:hypothetical protein
MVFVLVKLVVVMLTEKAKFKFQNRKKAERAINR